jgi:tetratricopeptide (TPR) repeat protein
MACALCAWLVCAGRATVRGAAQQDLDREFHTAVALYEGGKYPEAAVALEKLAKQAPGSFAVQELLGIVYASESQFERANAYFEAAVHLDPTSAAARTNFATNLVRLGKTELAEQQFRRAIALAPEDYEANHNLGELYARLNRVAEALPYLEHAQRIDSASYDNGYDLALAYLLSGRLADARHRIKSLISRKNTAELHNLLGQVEEKDGNFVSAANEFETAAHMDPSEGNIFDWGSELLLHRTLEPAIKVFEQGTKLYPDSPRMAIGLGMALYSLGKYDDAVKSLLRAADLNPSDPRGYPFLSRAFDSSPSQAQEVIERFRRFAEIAPQNGRAVYYYAMSLWKGKRAQDPNQDLTEIETLLKKSIALDPSLGEAHLQLANLYSDQKRFAEAVPEYLKARELNPDLADVHYRLAQAYVRLEEKDKAQSEFEVYRGLRAEHLSDLDRQRAEIRQFVYSEQQASDAKP